MKKLLMFLVASIAAFSIFAQTEKYNTLIYNADQYEQEEYWVYALGSYADAIAEDPSHAKEAFEKFNEIASNIKNGNPGNDIYPENELYSRWKNILAEAEQYWTENCPYSITIGPLELKSETKKTVSYWSDITINYSEKYILIMTAIEKGYKAAYDYSWDLPMPVREYSTEGYRYCSTDDYWPRVSVTKGSASKKGNVYSLTTKPEDFLKNSAATIGFSSNGPNDYEPRFEHGKHLKIFTDTAIGEFYNAFAYHEPMDIFCNTLYEVRISLYSKDGKDITSPSAFVLRHSFEKDEPGFRFEINDIPVAERENYENGNYFPILYDFKLHYGFQTSEMYNKPKGEEFFFTENEISNLPYLRLDENSINVYYSQLGEKDRFLAYYFSNLYKDNFDDVLFNKGPSHVYQTETGISYYISNALTDISYDDDYIEADDEDLGPCRIPLWIMANYCSDLMSLQPSYDKYGNQISDTGFIVALNPTNEYFTLKLNEEMSEEEKEKLLKETLAKAEALYDKAGPIYNYIKYCEYNDVTCPYDYIYIRNLYDQLYEAMIEEDRIELKKLIPQIEDAYTNDLYETAKKEYDRIFALSKKASQLYNEAHILKQKKRASKFDNIRKHH